MFEVYERGTTPAIDQRVAAMAFGELGELGELGAGDLRRLADAAAVRYGIRARVLRAIVSVESGWNTRAYRHEPGYFRRYVQGTKWARLWGGDSRRVAASYGLGQLMYPTAVQEGFSTTRPPEDLYDPALNLDLSARHLSRLWRRYGNVRDVAAAYNSGQPYAKAPSYTKTVYVPRVLRELGQVVAAAGDGGRPAVRTVAWLSVLALVGGLLLSGR